MKVEGANEVTLDSILSRIANINKGQ
jgi:hypothetical protein